MLYPRDPVPPFEAPSLDGGLWRLADQEPENFTMIVVYRSLHCVACKAYLKALNEQVSGFDAIGVEAFVVSADSRERAIQAKEEWDLHNLKMGYGLDLRMGHSWGLYISDRRNDAEPELFFEPGLFIIKRDGTLFYRSVQNLAFGRPEWGEVLMALNRFLELDIPARGQVKLAI